MIDLDRVFAIRRPTWVHPCFPPIFDYRHPVRFRLSTVDRVMGIAAAALLLQLAVTVALTGSDRGHALSHLSGAFIALGVAWGVMRLWQGTATSFERWARRGMIMALCASAAIFAGEAIAALGWAADGYLDRWPALTSVHDRIFVNLSVAALLLASLCSLVAMIALAARAWRGVHSRRIP